MNRTQTASSNRPKAATPGADGRTLAGLVRYFLKLGGSGFGGPIALVGYMQRELIEERRWYLHSGARGAVAVAIPFVLPPFLIVTAVAVLYAEYQGLAWVHDIFRGVLPAVLAIIAIAAYKLARSTNKADPVLWGIAAVLCAVTAIAGAEIVWLFLLAGTLGAIYYGGGLPKRHPGVAPPGRLMCACRSATLGGPQQGRKAPVRSGLLPSWLPTRPVPSPSQPP